MTQARLGKAAVAPDSAPKSASDDQQHGDRDSAGVDVMDPLAGLAESERLALAIRFGRIRMCAALTHGHSFASSIFRLPAKCLGCNELVWGPFTRGCVCLVCKVTAHRSCTGMAGMPPCPTKNIFADFCRSELGLPPLTISSAEPVSTAKVPTENGGGGGSDASARVQQERAGAGDLDEWATVEGAVAEDAGAVVEKQETTTTKAIVNTPTHFSWSPFATAASKQTVAEASSDKRHHDENHDSPHDQNHEALPIAAVLSPAGMEPACVPSDSSAGVLEEQAAADPAAAAGATMRIRDVGRMSVAGGVVGAVIGGPVGAVFGLKLGAFIGAGRWSVQGLWQRIEKDRREAGAAAVVVAEEEEAVALAPKCRDIWERIAESIEGEEQPVIWELDPEQKQLLEQGECDAGEVAMFVVGKVLADETTMPSRLYSALLGEFRSRRRLRDPHRPLRRRSSDTDMVALFPRAGGSRRPAEGDESRRRLDSGAGAPDDGGAFFANTPGLEKTFSFVEEAEIVEGEGSDAGLGDLVENGYASSADGSDIEGGDVVAPNTLEASTASSPHRAPGAARRTAAAAASKDSWRSNSSRMDSWVQLDGVGCRNCGGKVASFGPQGRFSTGSLGRDDVEEDEGGFGESWAAAEVPPCWCADDEGLSTTPEIVPCKNEGNVPASNAEDTRVTPGADTPTQEATGQCGPTEIRPAAVEPGRTEAISPRSSANGRGGEQAGKPEGSTFETIEKEGEAVAKEEACDALRDVHGVLRELTRAILAWCPMLTASDEAAIQAVNCIDQRVFSETYGPVYSRIASGQARERDATLAHRVRREERSRIASGRSSLTGACQPIALSALRAAGNARTGRDKLGFLVQAVERISEALPAKATTDTLLWSLCRHLAAATLSGGAGAATGRTGSGSGDRAPMPRPHAEVAFVEQFVRDESWLMGKQGYVLTTVDAALHVLLDPTMSDEVFLDPPPTPTAGEGDEGGGSAAGQTRHS